MGLEQEGGNNAAVENSLNAPQYGSGRASRRAAAAEVVEKTGAQACVLLHRRLAHSAMYEFVATVVTVLLTCTNT